jgi:hypothetical protein
MAEETRDRTDKTGEGDVPMMFEKYAKILQLGDPLMPDLFDGDYIVEEKVDGSCFRLAIDKEGNRYFGSKEVSYSDERPPDKMFMKAVTNGNAILDRAKGTWLEGHDLLVICEFFTSPKHNTLEYERAPKDNLMFLDVILDGNLLSHAEKKKVCGMLGMEQVAVLLEAKDRKMTEEELKTILDTPSMLGKVKVEGIVIKNYGKRYIAYNKSIPYMAKFVREEFKELNRVEWNQGVSLTDQIMLRFPKEARWMKAVHHLTEKNVLQGSMRDFPMLLEELELDFETECKEDIKEQLYHHYRHEVLSAMKRGCAEWYKARLAKQAVDADG